MKKENNTKIIFIDLDGTTLDIKEKGQAFVSQENVDAVQKCLQKGIQVVVSTGRGELKRTFEINEKLGLGKNIIFWNGSKVIKNGETIFEKHVKKHVVSELFKLAEKHRITTILNSDFRNHSYTKSIFFKLGILFKKGNPKKYEHFQNNFEVYKLIFWNPKQKKVDEFYKLLSEKFSDELTVSYAGEKNNFLEVTALNCSKGEAERIYAASENVDLKDCVHFGDSMNDASTANVVGTLIAMANGVRPLKEIANIVSEFDYKNGGLAKTIEKYIL
ncbi:Cof-type HAD-IIB family hydrolase [Mycoplasmopsis iners]|uniref:Cof-type HAD-IIB family hydrolase n=1 Tax=Mycoplasmopsis iners TaxID=76630 RepID=UPI00049580ED|nr:HAD family hydrolase [Mycoplasmopsis iners]